MATKNVTRRDSAFQESPKQRPAQTIRYGRLKATIWRQESEKGPWYSTVLTRTYRDQAGNWGSSGSFGVDDLLVTAKLADQAHSWILVRWPRMLRAQATDSQRRKSPDKRTCRSSSPGDLEGKSLGMSGANHG
jgi:hypothetical protein